MNEWLGKNVLVTGATGFIGSWLTKRLVQTGASVIAFSNCGYSHHPILDTITLSKTKVINGQLENFDLLNSIISEENIDTVFHLGAQTQVKKAFDFPLETFESNIRGTYHLLEACRRNKPQVKKIIVASSDKAYGPSECLPLKESFPLEGTFPYDVSKSCTDLISSSYYLTYKLPIVIVRASNIYGGGDTNWDRLIPGVLRDLCFNHNPTLRSDGSYLRDFLYVEDMVNAYIHLAECMNTKKIGGQAFNFGTGHPVSVYEIFSKLRMFLKKDHLNPSIENSAKAEIKDQYVCINKSFSQLGWRPKYNLEKGLINTVSWYVSYFSKATYNSNLSSIRQNSLLESTL